MRCDGSLVHVLGVLLVAALISGCHTVDTDGYDGEHSAWYLGLTRVSVVNDPDVTRASSVKLLGLWRDGQSLGLGFTARGRVFVAEECQVVFLVRSNEQFESVKRLVESEPDLLGGDLCLTLYQD
jgi:hypothetical protein